MYPGNTTCPSKALPIVSTSRLTLYLMTSTCFPPYSLIFATLCFLQRIWGSPELGLYPDFSTSYCLPLDIHKANSLNFKSLLRYLLVSLLWPSYLKFQLHQLTPIHYALHSGSPCLALPFFFFHSTYNFLICL